VVFDAPQHEDNTGEYGKHQGICKMLKKEMKFINENIPPFLTHYSTYECGVPKPKCFP
jgi:hypothetical protein